VPFPVHPKPFTSLSGLDLSKTLARKLIPVADLLRDLRTKFGMRPYEVHVIRTRWTGGERGIGEEYTKSDTTILPTPRIVDLTSLSEIVQPVGLDEVGMVTLDEISGRYTDDQLRGFHDDGTPPDPDENVFYEVVFPLPDGSSGNVERRRFFPTSAPHYTAGKFEWVVRLERTRQDRPRGDVEQ
jgi:hypothetical protein